jgi:DNA-binding beta-propeller fold protein YncE
MAGIRKKGDGYHCTFRFQGRRFYFAVGKVTEAQTLAKATEVDETLALLERGRLVVPEGVRLEDFVASGGKAPFLSARPETVTARQLFDHYLTTHANGTIEENSLATARTHLGQVRNPAQVETPKDTGPRHHGFHRSKAIAYVDNEQGSSATEYGLDTKAGTLSPLQALSTLPKDFGVANACAEIKIHPSGNLLYASNRGHDSIACFALDGDGRRGATGLAATETTPRSFDLDPSGRFLFAAGEGSGKVASYRIDPKTGELNRLET